MKLNVSDISLIPISTVLLLVQKEVLAFIANVQLVIFLVLLYSKKLGTKRTFLIIVLYVLIDALLTSTLSFTYTPFIFIGLMFIPILMNTIFINVENVFKLGIISVLFSFVYSWVFVLAFVILFKMNVIEYLIADIYFEILLAASSFVSTVTLYKPLSKLFDKYLNKQVEKNE